MKIDPRPERAVLPPLLSRMLIDEHFRIHPEAPGPIEIDRAKKPRARQSKVAVLGGSQGI
jgi:hypothetical protein